MTWKAWLADLRDCALVAVLFSTVGVVGMCLLSHPILLTLLLTLGGWYLLSRQSA